MSLKPEGEFTLIGKLPKDFYRVTQKGIQYMMIPSINDRMKTVQPNIE